MDRKEDIKLSVTRHIVSGLITFIFTIVAILTGPSETIDGVIYLEPYVFPFVMAFVPVVYVLFTYIFKKAQNYKRISEGKSCILGKARDWATYKKVLSYISAFWFSALFTVGLYEAKKITQNQYGMINVVTWALITLLLSGFLTKSKKKAVIAKPPEQEHEPVLENAENSENCITDKPTRCCYMCGVAVGDSGKFCENCGAKVAGTFTTYVEPSNENLSKYGGVESALLTIDLMDGHEFEYWTADMLRDMGFNSVEVTRGSGDQGVDVLAEKGGVKYAIQCKRYTSNLGNTPIQEVHAGKDMYHCHVGVVITNQYFTKGAKQLAEATGTLLWDRKYIEGYLTYKQKNKSESCCNPRAYSNNDTEYHFSDEMIQKAIRVILETDQASVSMLERKLGLGFADSAQLMDQLESMKIVGPLSDGKPRKILISKLEYEK